MRVGLYSPYLDTLGGGEKYMMTIAETLSQDHEVDILLDQHLYNFGPEYLKKELSSRFNLDLERTKFLKSPLGKGSYFLERLAFLKKYDLLFYLTDGSIFIPSAKKNILHIQSPIVGQAAKSNLARIKLKGWNLIIYNSEFTKINSSKNWPLKSKVIYPPVDVEIIKPLKKKKYILSVGRFFGFLKDKKHGFLIKAFRELYESRQLPEWSLHLVGSASEGDKNYLEELQDLAQGLPVKFYPNLGYKDLIVLYGESSIYWHASGYGEKDPTKMEHFGISTVEAMAGGCVPIVISKGGQIEIVEQGRSGFLWNNLSELKKFTIQVIGDETLVSNLSKEALVSAKRFSKDRFENEIKELV